MIYFSIRIRFIPHLTLFTLVPTFLHTYYRVFSISILFSRQLIGVSSIKIFVLSPKL